MKKTIALILILVFLFAAVPVHADDFKLNADAALLIDMATGEVLYEDASDEKLNPAGLTKMLVTILTIENLNMRDGMTVQPEWIKNVGGSNFGLYANEEINIGVALSAYAMAGGNDLANAFAYLVSGSPEAFVQLMNEKAEEIGCTDTNITNVTGMDDEKQHTTCADLAKIAQYCMQNNTFKKVVAKTTLEVYSTNTSPVRYISNTNLLLYDETPSSRVFVNNILRFCKYEGCIGICSGYTQGGGGGLVSAVTKQGSTLLCVVLGSGAMEKYSDTIQLYDWGFANYKTVRVLNQDYDAGTIPVKGAKIKTVPIKVEDVSYATIPSDASANNLSTTLLLDDYVVAPVKAGTVVGKIQFMIDATVVGEYDVVVAEDVEEGGFLNKIGLGEASIQKIVIIFVSVIAVLAALIIAFVVIDRYKTIQRKAERARRRAEMEEKEAVFKEALEKNRTDYWEKTDE